MRVELLGMMVMSMMFQCAGELVMIILQWERKLFQFFMVVQKLIVQDAQPLAWIHVTQRGHVVGRLSHLRLLNVGDANVSKDFRLFLAAVATFRPSTAKLFLYKVNVLVREETGSRRVISTLAACKGATIEEFFGRIRCCGGSGCIALLRPLLWRIDIGCKRGKFGA